MQKLIINTDLKWISLLLWLHRVVLVFKSIYIHFEISPYRNLDYDKGRIFLTLRTCCIVENPNRINVISLHASRILNHDQVSVYEPPNQGFYFSTTSKKLCIFMKKLYFFFIKYIFFIKKNYKYLRCMCHTLFKFYNLKSIITAKKYLEF